MRGDDTNVDDAGHQQGELGWHLHARQDVEPFVLEITDPRREQKAEQTTHRKYVIRESAGVGVMLVDDEAALVIKQTVKNVGRLIGRRGDDLGMKRCKLI